MLRCKMRVESVTQAKSGDGSTESETVKLTAVSGGNGSENAGWSKWTPSANFSIQINNPDAFGRLSKGHEFFVDFTPVPKAVPVVEAMPVTEAPREEVSQG